MMVVVGTYPEWGQSVVLRTWPTGSMSLLALRDFELLDHSGRKLLGATSGWLVLDLLSRRPQRVEPILANIRRFPSYRALDAEAARLPARSDLPSPTVLEVKHSDLDLNDHVNNATYARWILDSYPTEFHRAHLLRSMTINFLAEVTGEDFVLLSRPEPEKLRNTHTIRRKIDGADACRAELVWEAGE
jgi:acyl-ACP thioesterase